MKHEVSTEESSSQEDEKVAKKKYKKKKVSDYIKKIKITQVNTAETSFLEKTNRQNECWW